MSVETAGTAIARKQVSRRKLLDAARELFVERGYHDTRPQDIARAAGVGHGTFYLHFADKRECFLAFVEEASNEVDHYTKEWTKDAKDFGDLIRGTLRGCIAHSKDHPGVMRAAMVDASVIGGEARDLLDTHLNERWAAQWTSRLEAMRDQGIARRDLDVRVMGFAVVGACALAFNAGQRQGIPVETVIDNLAQFLVRAIDPR